MDQQNFGHTVVDGRYDPSGVIGNINNLQQTANLNKPVAPFQQQPILQNMATSWQQSPFHQFIQGLLNNLKLHGR